MGTRSWTPEEDGDEWRVREWVDLVFEGEVWRISQEDVQYEIGPEFEMYRFGREPPC